MKQTMEAALALGRRLSPSKIEEIANGAAEGLSTSKMLSMVGSVEAKSRVNDFLTASKEEQVDGKVAAAILLSMNHAYLATSKELDTELVVTGPETPWVPTRRTEQVLLDVINLARRELFLVSFVANDWQKVIEALVAADRRGVAIRVLMEASKSEGGTLDKDQTSGLVAAVPKAGVYRWTGKTAEHSGGRVHAKVALADRDTAFITSANFTGHAMEKNIEVGVLARGGSIARDLSRHFDGLIETKVLTRVGT